MIIHCKIYFVSSIFVVCANHENILQQKFPDLRYVLLCWVRLFVRYLMFMEYINHHYYSKPLINCPNHDHRNVKAVC